MIWTYSWGFEWIIYGIENATLFITNQPIMEWFIGQYCNLYVFLCKSRVHLKGNGWQKNRKTCIVLNINGMDQTRNTVFFLYIYLFNHFHYGNLIMDIHFLFQYKLILVSKLIVAWYGHTQALFWLNFCQKPAKLSCFLCIKSIFCSSMIHDPVGCL